MRSTFRRVTILTILTLTTALAVLAGPVGYTFDVTTSYSFGCGPGIDLGLCGSPDTGFLTVLNSGLSAFTGTITLSGAAPSQTINLVFSSGLSSGAQVVFGAGPESSNQGGFNKQGGALPDLGLTLQIAGTVMIGADTQAINLSVSDRDIHSGVFRLNPFGESLDNYVLQGGDPFGRDTGDAFEESQAPGRFEFFDPGPDGKVPEPGSLGLVGAGLALAILRLRRR